MPYANNKGADQPAHPRSLISAFVVHCLDSTIPHLPIAEISSPYLVSVAAQAGFCLTRSQTPKTGFLVTRLNYQHNFGLYWIFTESFSIISITSMKLLHSITARLHTSVYMSHVARKPVFGVCDQLRLKLACSATEAI